MYWTRVTASLLACTALAAPASAQGKPFKDALPANTLAFFSAPDLDASLQEFQSTALARMWREREVQDFVKDALKLAQSKWKEGLEQLQQLNDAGKFPLKPEDLTQLRVHSFGAALTSFRVGMGKSGRPEPSIGILVHFDFGPSAPTWRKLVDIGADALVGKARGNLERSESKLDGDVRLITLTPKQTDMSINAAFVGNGLVLGSKIDEVKACVAAITGQKTILPVAADYRDTAKYIDTSGAELEIYVHVAGVVDALMDALRFAEKNAPDWPPELQVAGLDRALSALGLRCMRAVGYSSRYEGSKSVTRGFMLAPESARTGLFAKQSGALDLGFLKWVPKEVASVTASHLDFAGVYDGLVAAVKAYNPEQADALLGMLEQQEKQVGLSLKDELFGAFGDQMIWWSMGVQNFMSAPEGALLLKVKDQDRLLATLKKVAKMTGGMIEFPESERSGVKTWRLEVNPEMLGRPEIANALAVVQPSFAFKDGYMVMALANSDVRKALKRMEREDDPKDDIRSNREFAAYLAQFKQQKISSFDWTDWKTSFESLYTAATQILSFAVSADEVPFDMTLLPEAETLSQHLFSSATWSMQNKDGYVSTNTSPLGPEVVLGATLVGVGAGLTAVGMTTTARAAPAVRRQPAATRPTKKGDGEGAGDSGEKKSGEKKSGEEKPGEKKSGEKASGNAEGADRSGARGRDRGGDGGDGIE